MKINNILATCAMFSTLIMAAPSEAALMTGLQAYYSFDSDATDQVGTFDGTVVGANHTASGKISGAYDFTGTNHINIGTPMPVGNAARALSLWVKPKSDGAVGIFNAGNPSQPTSDFGVYLGDNGDTYGNANDFVYIRRNFEDPMTTRTANIQLNAWNHIVISYDGSSTHNVQFYINDQLFMADSGWASDVSFDTAFAMQLIGSGPQPTDAYIDEVGIWNRSLSTQEVSELYNSGAGIQLGTQNVPEPAPFLLIGTAIVGLGWLRRRKTR